MPVILRVLLSQLGLAWGPRAAGQSVLVIVTDELLFLFFVFSPLFFLLGSCFLSPLSFPSMSDPFPTLYVLPSASWPLFVVSQLEVLHYRLNVSSALHSPAQPSLQALHAYQVLTFPSLPLPQGRLRVCVDTVPE